MKASVYIRYLRCGGAVFSLPVCHKPIAVDVIQKPRNNFRSCRIILVDSFFCHFFFLSFIDLTKCTRLECADLNSANLDQNFCDPRIVYLIVTHQNDLQKLRRFNTQERIEFQSFIEQDEEQTEELQNLHNLLHPTSVNEVCV